MNVVGIEVRQTNLDCCEFARSKVDLPNLKFIRDDAWALTRYGRSMSFYCNGLF